MYKLSTLQAHRILACLRAMPVAGLGLLALGASKPLVAEDFLLFKEASPEHSGVAISKTKAFTWQAGPWEVPVVRDVTAGHHFTCVLLESGTVRCWGRNGYGELGDGTTTNRTRPAPVPGLGNVVGIAAGYHHTCALIEDRTVQCWGHNNEGQLGDGTTTRRTRPTPVSGLENVVGLAEATYHTCALMDGGTVQCWGHNRLGELGDGTTTNRTRPTPVLGLENVVGLAAEAHHTCALMDGGTVQCWGRNVHGQLGDSTTEDRARPVLSFDPSKQGPQVRSVVCARADGMLVAESYCQADPKPISLEMF
ncbi:MAG: hypothetical protein AAF442_02305 [Pseudomonadota bacterium]